MNDLDYTIARLNSIADKIGEAGKQIQNNASFTLTDRIDMVKAQICDHYCKYPLIYDDDDRLQQECDKCPMKWLN